MPGETLDGETPSHLSPEPTSVTITTTYMGLLPPPSSLQGYEAVLPGAAERILALAERQLRHRQDFDSGRLRISARIATAAHRERMWGIVLGFVLSAGALGGAIVAGGWIGAMLGAGGLAGLAGAFLIHLRHRD